MLARTIWSRNNQFECWSLDTDDTSHLALDYTAVITRVICLSRQDAIRGMISALLYTLRSLLCLSRLSIIQLYPFCFWSWSKGIWGQGPVLLVECCSSANWVAQHVGSASFLPDFGASVLRSVTMCPRTRAVAISSSSRVNRLCLYSLRFTFYLSRSTPSYDPDFAVSHKMVSCMVRKYK
jgi:hypothetical protein